MNIQHYLIGLILIGFLVGCSNVGFQINVLPPNEATATAQASELSMSPTLTPADTATSEANLGRLAFVSKMDGDLAIYTINNDGTMLTRLTSEPMLVMHPTWSPDGAQIAFEACQGGDFSTDCPEGESFDIYVVNADGSNLTNLTNHSAADRFPSWLPSGEIAFSSDRSGKDEIYRMNADGSGLKQITNGQTRNDEPRWSPDGRWLAYHCTQDSTTEICILPASGSDQVIRIAGTSPVWSPMEAEGGLRLAFHCFQHGHSDICTVLPDGSGLVNLTNSPADEIDPSWSPDGQTLAFQFIGPNRSDPIYLLDVASGQIREVPGSQTGEGVNPALIWSPDGSAITVAALGEACPRFVDVQTGEERMRLGKPGQCSYIPPLLFLPDGQTVAIHGQAGGLDLLRFPDGARIRSLQSAPDGIIGRLIEFPAAGGSLFMDPAGQWLASRGGYEPCYCGNPADQPYHPLILWDLSSGAAQAQLERAIEPLAERHRLAATFEGDNILMLYESGEITRWRFNDPQAVETVVAHVPVRPASAWTLRWSGDGSHLAFSGRYGGVDIYATATQQLVQRFDPPLETPAFSPDGSLVALYDSDQSAEVIYEVRSGQPLLSLPATPVLMGAAFSPDVLYLAYGDGARAMVTEVASDETTTLDPAPAAPVAANMTVSRLIWSPDGQSLATVFGVANGDSVGPGMIVLWKRLEDGSFEAVYHVPNVQANYPLPNQVLAIFNPSGSRIAFQSMDALEAGHIRLVVYDLESRRVLQNLSEYKPGAWMNDDELLAAEAQYYTRLTRFNVISGKKTVGNGVDNGDNAYAPGGMFTAQMAEPPGRGITVRHWQSGRVVARGEHESLNLLDYLWSSDGRWMASIGDDGTLIIWLVLMP